MIYLHLTFIGVCNTVTNISKNIDWLNINRPILVTGAAGFIGFHLCQKLLEKGLKVIGLDNLNDYYSVQLKHDRLTQLVSNPKFKFVHLDLGDQTGINQLFTSEQPVIVVNLAAQAGVRYSLTHPHVYLESNLHGFLNILEGCRHNQVEHLVFASSSSVYGLNTAMPFSTSDNVDHPISLYAASKKANELMAHSYSYLYGLPTTGLRFFSVYGPWGRPDMAMFIFTKTIIEGGTIDVFNHGQMRRDFTYINDIIDGIMKVIVRIPQGNPDWSGDNPDPSTSKAPYKLYNIGNNQPVQLMYMIELLEKCLDRKVEKRLLPMQPGDVPVNYADITDLTENTGFQSKTSIEEGIPKFVDWYLDYYQK